MQPDEKRSLRIAARHRVGDWNLAVRRPLENRRLASGDRLVVEATAVAFVNVHARVVENQVRLLADALEFRK